MALETITKNSGPFAPYNCGGSTPYKSSQTIRRDRRSTTNYHARLKVGEFIPPLDYLHSITGYDQVLYARTYGRKTDFRKCFGGFSLDFDQAISEADSKALSSIRNAANKLNTSNLGVSIAEGRKTVSHIASTATRIFRAYDNVKRGRFSKAFQQLGFTKTTEIPRSLKQRYRVKTLNAYRKRKIRDYKTQSDLTSGAANSWLEVQFGWMPLLNDIHENAESLANLWYQKKPPLYHFKGYSFANIDENDFNMSNSFDTRSTFKAEGQAGRYYSVLASIGNPDLFTARTFGLTNPASIAWEAIPFSFVLDWILPINNYLDGFSAFHGLEFFSGFRSTKKEGICGGKAKRTIRSWYTYVWEVDLHFYERTFQREVLFDFPGNPNFPSVNPGNLLDSWKLTTALSLARKIFS